MLLMIWRIMIKVYEENSVEPLMMLKIPSTILCLLLSFAQCFTNREFPIVWRNRTLSENLFRLSPSPRKILPFSLCFSASASCLQSTSNLFTNVRHLFSFVFFNEDNNFAKFIIFCYPIIFSVLKYSINNFKAAIEKLGLSRLTQKSASS